MARPCKFTPKLGDEICHRLACGSGTLNRICRDEKMPCERSIRGWVLQGAGEPIGSPFRTFHDKYRAARKLQAEALLDEGLDISDDGTNDTQIDPDTGAVIVNHDHINRSKLRVNTRQHLASKLDPERFGDKVTVENSGPGGGPQEHVIRWAQTASEATPDPSAK